MEHGGLSYRLALVLALALLAANGCSRSGSGSSANAPPGVAAPAASASGAERGARLYEANCVACHQADGHGIPGVYPSLAGSALVLGEPRPLVRWIVRGIRPPSLPAGRYATQMPHFGWMTPADAAALATYLRSSFGNRAAPVTDQSLGSALAD